MAPPTEDEMQGSILSWLKDHANPTRWTEEDLYEMANLITELVFDISVPSFIPEDENRTLH